MSVGDDAGNINKFALDLEKKVYEDDTNELALPVKKRVKSANRIEFIKECIYKYYLVPVEASRMPGKRSEQP
ncbi:unnamed protein product [Cylicocyclus nassatus]|uniref:Uncharacterized protein n=1 Tax=Cylicocyclus nassatus TaxID=53992 RepID=A0AA36HFE0_CYLNA|nr:unnamed protein product [Cylicocyclus nassatus]